jgi:Dolichyl-phosphate-mannose-protein mannosyltransferase
MSRILPRQPDQVAQTQPAAAPIRWIWSQVRSGRFVAEPLIALALAVAGFWNLNGQMIWWDEGWTLSVARNWVERGHYGRLLDGQLAPPGLEAAFVVTGPIALSMRLFGVGIWQGRVFGVLCMLAAFALLYYLALRLYNRAIALGTLAVLLLTPMHPMMHALLIGRQVLAEMPMLCYLLGGYVCLLLALRRSCWFLLPAMLLGGVGLTSKLQAIPFWTLSLLVPLGAALVRRRWRVAVVLAILLVGSFALAQVVPLLQRWVLQGHTQPAQQLVGIFEVTAFVPLLVARERALFHLLAFGWPSLLGVCYEPWRWWAGRAAPEQDDAAATIRLALLAFAMSWVGWFALLSVGWPRYLFPATFVASMFTAALLYEATDGFNLRPLLMRASTALRYRRFDRQHGGALLIVLFIAATVPLTLLTVYRGYAVETSDGLLRAAQVLNTQTPPDALVETYEAEVHFMLQRRYHYPPDQLHIELTRRAYLDQDVPIDYNPLTANPDYLVVGRIGRTWWLYNPALAHFRVLGDYGEYTIYERVRP